MTSFQEEFFDGFRHWPREQQSRVVMLGSNAEFVLRMTANTPADTVVGRVVHAIREALQRGLDGTPEALALARFEEQLEQLR